MSEYSRDSELQIRSNLLGSEYFTCIYQGKNYRVQFQKFAEFLGGVVQTGGQAQIYWQTVPTYSIETLTLTVDPGGVAYYNNQTNVIGGQVLNLAAIQTPGLSRFDAILLDLSAGTYQVVTGAEAADPATPGYNAADFLLLTYLLIDENEVVANEPPQSHPRNEDEYLALGTVDQVSANEIRLFLDAYTDRDLGQFPTLLDLQTEHPAPALNSFATVENEQALYVFDSSGTYRAYGSASNGGGGASGQTFTFPFVVYSDIDNPAEPGLLLEGPHEFTDQIIDNKLTGVSWLVRLSTSATWIEQADLTALNTWIVSNVPTEATKFHVTPLANFGVNTGAAAITLIETIE